MEIGRDWDADWKNQWPTEADVPGFKQSMLDFYEVRVIINCYVSLYVGFISSFRLATTFMSML